MVKLHQNQSLTAWLNIEYISILIDLNMIDQESLQSEKRKQFEEYLAKQERQRQEALAIKKKKEEDTKNTSEKMLVIQKEFKSRQQQVDSLVQKYKAKQIKYDDVINKYNQLKNYYLQINYALYTYDRQGYKQTLEKILTDIQDLKKKLEPRKKFKFSRRDEDFGVKIVKEEKKLEEKEGYESTIPGLQNISNQTILVAREKLGGPFKIINAENCVVYLNGITDILFLKQLKNCKIYAGPTKSTVFIDNCINCEIVINCHQLRIHNTYDTTFEIFTSSKGIIQDTKNVIFKRYNYKYVGIEDDIRSCERQGKQNLWKDIQDFNWLKQEASPNFTLVEQERPNS